jgi:hypothetical protein
MRKAIVVVLSGCALFWAGRCLHPSERASSGRLKTSSDPVHVHDAAETVRAALAKNVRVRAVAADELERRAQSQLGREAANTIHEPEAHRQARRTYLAHEIDRIYPSLPAAKRDQMLAVNDRNEAEFRQHRAGFMLGDLTEDEYIAELKDMVRRGVEDTKSFLTREEFIALEGNPDYDPFDPRAHSVPDGPQYLSADEAAAIEKHADSAAIGPPDRGPRTPR